MSNNRKEISVIIVNYFMGREVEALLQSLLKHTSDIPYEVIVVDNNSEDAESLALPERFGDKSGTIQFLKMEENVGFAAGCNAGAKRASGDILFFLNPDALVSDNIIKDAAVSFASLSKRSIMGINSSGPGLFDFSAGYFPKVFFEILNIWYIGRWTEAAVMGLRKKNSDGKKLSVDWVLGASLIIRKETFWELNGFDEDYFLYFEEMDLCKRLKKSGGSVQYDTALSFIHIGSVSTRKNYEFFTKTFYRSKLIFLEKHYNGLLLLIHRLLLFLQSLSQIILWILLYPVRRKKSSGKIRGFLAVLNMLFQKTETGKEL